MSYSRVLRPLHTKGRSCCVCCNKESETTGVEYFRLPDEPMLRMKWINAVPESYFFIPSENTFFCSDHFHPIVIPMNQGLSDNAEHHNLKEFVPSHFVKTTSLRSINIKPIIGSTLGDISTAAVSSTSSQTINNYLPSGSSEKSSTQQCSEPPSSYATRPLLTTSRKPYKRRTKYRTKVIPSYSIPHTVFPKPKSQLAPGFKAPLRKIKPATSYTPIHPKTSYTPIHPKTSFGESPQIATTDSPCSSLQPFITAASSNALVTSNHAISGLQPIMTNMLSKSTIPSLCHASSNIQPVVTVSYVMTTSTSSSPISSIPSASALPHSTIIDEEGCPDEYRDTDSPILVEAADPLQLEDIYSPIFNTKGTDPDISDPESPDIEEILDIGKSEQVSNKQLQSCCACDERNMDRVTYHKFPSHCLTRTKWVKTLDVIDFNLEMLRYMAVCSRHFDIDDYNEYGELKEKAVPSRFDKDELSKMTRRKLSKFREPKEHTSLLNVILPVDIHDSIEEMKDIRVALNRLDTKEFQSTFVVTSKEQENIRHSEVTYFHSGNNFKKELHEYNSDISNLKIEVTPEIKAEDLSIDNSVSSAGIENIDLPLSIKTENIEDTSISTSSSSSSAVVDPCYILPKDVEFSTGSKMDLPLNPLNPTHEFATDDSLHFDIKRKPSSPKILPNSNVILPKECSTNATDLSQSQIMNHISNNSNSSSNISINQSNINGLTPIQVILNGNLCTFAYPKNQMNPVIHLNGEISPMGNVNQTQNTKFGETRTIKNSSPRLIASQKNIDKIKILQNNSLNPLANQSSEQNQIQNNFNSIKNHSVQIRHTQNIQNSKLNIASRNNNLLGRTKKPKRKSLNNANRNYNLLGLTKTIQDKSLNNVCQNINLLGRTKKTKSLNSANQNNNLLGQTQSFQNNQLNKIPKQNIPLKQAPIIHNSNSNLAVNPNNLLNTIHVQNNNLNAVAVSQINQIPIEKNTNAYEPSFLQNNTMFDQSSYSNSMITAIPISAKSTDPLKILPMIQSGSSNINLYSTNSINSGIFVQNRLISQSASHNSNISMSNGISIQNANVNFPVNSNENSGLESPIQNRSVPIVHYTNQFTVVNSSSSCRSTESVQNSSNPNCSSNCNESLKSNEETQNLKTKLNSSRFDVENRPVNPISDCTEMKNSNVINNAHEFENSDDKDIVANEPKTGFYLSNKQISSCNKIVFPIGNKTYVFEKNVSVRHLLKPSREAPNSRQKDLTRRNLELKKKVKRFHRQYIAEKLVNKKLRRKLSEIEESVLEIEPKFKFKDFSFSFVDIFGVPETVASAIYERCISKIRNTAKTRRPIQSNVLNFASLLFIYSPDAYSLVRNTFHGALPSINHINEYINSVVNKGIEKEVLLDELETLKYSNFKRDLPSDWLMENYSFKIHKNTESIERRNSKARKFLNKTNDNPTESSSSPNEFRSEKNISVNSIRENYVTLSTFSDVIDDDSPSSDEQFMCTESIFLNPPSTVKKDSNQPCNMTQDGYSDASLNTGIHNVRDAARTNDAVMLHPLQSQFADNSDHLSVSSSCSLTQQQNPSAECGDGEVASRKRKRKRIKSLARDLLYCKRIKQYFANYIGEYYDNIGKDFEDLNPL